MIELVDLGGRARLGAIPVHALLRLRALPCPMDLEASPLRDYPAVRGAPHGMTDLQRPRRRRSAGADGSAPVRRPPGPRAPGPAHRPPQRVAAVPPVLEPLLAACTAACTRRPTSALLAARLRGRRGASTRARSASPAIPYITHPLAVATILANLGMDTTTLVAALLHDTIEDTDYRLEQMDEGVRRRGQAARRRRHQARQGQARRRGSRPRPSARWWSRWPRTRGYW